MRRTFDAKRFLPTVNDVETVVCLVKKNASPRDYIEIGVDAEDYYRIKDADTELPY